MMSIDCHELTFDEQLALAAAVSDGLGGRAVGMIKDDSIVLDQISGQTPALSELETIVRSFVAKRKDARYYSVEVVGEKLIVHSPDPLARSRGRKDTGLLLPDNLLKCPFCNFVTPYQELYDVHFRSHGFGA